MARLYESDAKTLDNIAWVITNRQLLNDNNTLPLLTHVKIALDEIIANLERDDNRDLSWKDQ